MMTRRFRYYAFAAVAASLLAAPSVAVPPPTVEDFEDVYDFTAISFLGTRYVTEMKIRPATSDFGTVQQGPARIVIRGTRPIIGQYTYVEVLDTYFIAFSDTQIPGRVGAGSVQISPSGMLSGDMVWVGVRGARVDGPYHVFGGLQEEEEEPPMNGEYVSEAF